MHRRVRLHLLIAAVMGIAVGTVALLVAHWHYAPSLAWDAAAITYLLLTWTEIWKLSPQQTKEIAEGEDPSHILDDAIVLVAAMVSLVTVVLVLSHIGSTPESSSLTRSILGIASVVLAWAVVHTVYTVRYAKLYFEQPEGGLDFKSEGMPQYSDFAYVAFGIGMTFQVADTDVQTAKFRKTILGHALLSFLFATTILAITINLVAGLNT